VIIIVIDNIQLSPLLECDPTFCLTQKSRVTQGLYRIFWHQTPSNRIPAALRTICIFIFTICHLMFIQQTTNMASSDKCDKFVAVGEEFFFIYYIEYFRKAAGILLLGVWCQNIRYNPWVTLLFCVRRLLNKH
jgi:hypothetical protein